MISDFRNPPPPESEGVVDDDEEYQGDDIHVDVISVSSRETDGPPSHFLEEDEFELHSEGFVA